MSRTTNRSLQTAVLALACLCVRAPLFAAENGRAENSGVVQKTAKSSDGLVSVTVAIEATKIQVAEAVDVTIVLRAPDGSDARFPDSEELQTQLGNWNLLQRTQQRDIPASGARPQRLWQWTLTFETLRTEPGPIPAVKIRYQLPGAKNNTWETISTPSLAVEVKSVVEDDRDVQSFHGIKGALPLPAADGDESGLLSLLIAGIVVVVILVLAAGWYFRRSFRKRNPTREAENAIAMIESEYREGSRSPGETIIALDRIIRALIQTLFKIPAMALSNEELLTRLADRAITTNGSDESSSFELVRLIEEADKAKYAGQETPGGMAEKLLGQSFRIVDWLSKQHSSASQAEAG